MTDVQAKFHGDLTCCFDVMISAQCTDARLLNNEYCSCVYGGSFSIIIQPTPTKFGGHIGR